MKILWKPRANNFWLGQLNAPTKVLLKSFDGSYHDSNIQDIGYVAKEVEGFVVKFYGSVYSGRHPVERIVFDTKELAMESAERHALAILAAKILSR